MKGILVKPTIEKNMVGPGDVDDMLEIETKEECQKYGEVNKVIIFEVKSRSILFLDVKDGYFYVSN